MSLLARSIATLEGIALAWDPDYQLVAQAYPFVVRKLLRNDARSSVLRDILYDADGKLQPTRLGSLLNAALGFVAEETSGFVDFDAVPKDGTCVYISNIIVIYIYIYKTSMSEKGSRG